MHAKIYNSTWWVSCTDSIEIKSAVEIVLLTSGFTLINFIDHDFLPQGYTALWLLSESHAAIHTFPEESKTYIELSSCVESLLINFELMFDHIIQRNQWQRY